MSIGIMSEHVPVSWFHPRGVHKAVARIEHRLPDVAGSLFLTLTINPAHFASPENAFEYARDRIRKMFYGFRRGMKWEGKTIRLKCPYLVKVEFHENGWPHFHIIALTKRFLPAELLRRKWGLGRTEVKRISTEQFQYLLKYVTKGMELPDWVAKRRRLRIFQPSRGFLLLEERKASRKDSAEPRPPRKRRQCATIGERFEKWRRMARLSSEDGTWVRTFALSCAFRTIFDHLILSVARDGRYLGGGKIVINNRKELVQWETKALQLKRNPASSCAGWSSRTPPNLAAAKTERDAMSG